MSVRTNVVFVVEMSVQSADVNTVGPRLIRMKWKRKLVLLREVGQKPPLWRKHVVECVIHVMGNLTTWMQTGVQGKCVTSMKRCVLVPIVMSVAGTEKVALEKVVRDHVPVCVHVVEILVVPT
tara:strand:+ start:20 stop:388 length:369 start_codon:yes stop_codon:yes gene_type:complete